MLPPLYPFVGFQLGAFVIRQVSNHFTLRNMLLIHFVLHSDCCLFAAL